MIQYRFNSSKIFSKLENSIIKLCIIGFEKVPWKSLIYKRKNKGPIMDP